MGIVEVLAILLSPLIALQVSARLDALKERRQRKVAIYRILMATRAQNLTWDHINALNSIDIDFAGPGKKDKAVCEKWKEYLDHLGDDQMEPGQWGTARIEKLVELLFVMGPAVGYAFDKVHLKRGIYSPRFHGRLEEDNEVIRTMARQLLEGKAALRVRVEEPIE